MSNPSIVSPVGMTFQAWVHTLTIDFPSDIIPLVPSESDWKQNGNVIANSPSFAAAGVPNTSHFDNWMDWAKQVFGVMK